MEQISLEDINLDIIPIKVLQDVDRRIADWRAAGGKDSDTYIQNQLRYLKRVELMAKNAADTITLLREVRCSCPSRRYCGGWSQNY